jgi:glycerol-3-phosphate dehydrogenase
VHGNVIIGPSAEYIDEADAYACTPEVMDKLWQEAQALLPALKRRYIIGNYSGIRAKLAPENEGGYRDFVIQEEEECPGLINLVGIESPGLTASRPIALMVAEMVGKTLALTPKENAVRTHRFPPVFAKLEREEQERLIREDPEYGEIVCRCRRVTKAEIRQAIENPLGARSLAAVKYRAWATTGRCSGGYCLNRIVDMLVREYGVKPEAVTLRGSGSEMFSGEVK